MRSPRKLSSPEKRFPIKVSSPEKRPALEKRTLTMEDVLRDNEGLTKAIQILEGEDSVLIHEENVADDTLTSLRGAEDDGPNMVCVNRSQILSDFKNNHTFFAPYPVNSPSLLLNDC
jgi:hypothetical protein